MRSGTGGTSAFLNSKKAIAEGRTILRADESGFYLLPALLRTWGAVAQTPVIQRKLSYDHRNAISMTGDLYLAVQDRSYQSPDVIGFLKQLLAEIPGKLLVIWDSAPIHRAGRSRTTWPRARPSGSSWNSCLGMLRS